MISDRGGMSKDLDLLRNFIAHARVNIYNTELSVDTVKLVFMKVIHYTDWDFVKDF